MDLPHSPTELTTAGSDAVLGLLALAIALALRHRANGYWLGVFAATAVAAVLGAVLHGLPWPAGWARLLWQPLYLALVLAMTVLLAATVHDWRGPAAARTNLRTASVPALLAYALLALRDDFTLFVLYEAAILLLVIGITVQHYRRRPQPALAWVLAGLLITLLAALVQAGFRGTLVVGWAFDHNGLFHLLQLPGLLCLYAGLRQRPPAH